jgi:hypothetical protein
VRPEGGADVAVAGGEAAGDVLGRLLGGEEGELHRTGLGVEGALPVGEEGVHHPHGRAGEDVAGRVGVVLDLGADDGVGVGRGGEDVLELVEDDEDPGAPPLVEADREGEAFEERRLGRGELHSRGAAGDADTHGGSQSAAQAVPPAGHRATQVPGPTAGGSSASKAVSCHSTRMAQKARGSFWL